MVNFMRHLNDASDGTGYSISYLHEITSGLVIGNDQKEALEWQCRIYKWMKRINIFNWVYIWTIGPSINSTLLTMFMNIWLNKVAKISQDIKRSVFDMCNEAEYCVRVRVSVTRRRGEKSLRRDAMATRRGDLFSPWPSCHFSDESDPPAWLV